jgi:hypothetical protein
MSSTMEGQFQPAVLEYYSLLAYCLPNANCVIPYRKRYVWLNNRLGEKLVAALSRCENS